MQQNSLLGCVGKCRVTLGFLRPRQLLTVTATAADGSAKSFQVLARIDTPEELSYYKNGGILPYVLRSLVKRA